VFVSCKIFEYHQALGLVPIPELEQRALTLRKQQSLDHVQVRTTDFPFKGTASRDGFLFKDLHILIKFFLTVWCGADGFQDFSKAFHNY
jgi:hypothetical protein